MKEPVRTCLMCMPCENEEKYKLLVQFLEMIRIIMIVTIGLFIVIAIFGLKY